MALFCKEIRRCEKQQVDFRNAAVII